MHVIHARNVADALPQGLRYLKEEGVWEETRAGRALVAPGPVTTVYAKPRERVLLSPIRDANPFFHLAEALWMIAGRRDAAFLDNFIPDFGKRFAEEDGNIHGAYGYRWRHQFNQPGTDGSRALDQLTALVKELRGNPSSRQAVLTMWDPTTDLGVEGLKDRPCNTHVYFRVQDLSPYRDPPVTDQNSAEIEAAIVAGGYAVLNMTVLCRSNDAIMGAYGANAVHFSVLQEYLASKIGVRVGTYYQVSNNFHAYERDLNKMAERHHKSGSHYDLPTELQDRAYGDRKVSPVRLIDVPENFDSEMDWMLEAYEAVVSRGSEIADPSIHHTASNLSNKFLSQTVWPMLMVHRSYRLGRFENASYWAYSIEASDWKRAAREWLERRKHAALRAAS